jgi:hypothetical protein
MRRTRGDTRVEKREQERREGEIGERNERGGERR